MKKLIVPIIVLFIFSLQLRSEDYLDTIAIKSCECINKLDFDKSNKQQLTTRLGLCMIQQAQPYADRLQKDYNLDFNNLNGSEGERLGQLIGTRMAIQCPQTLMKFSAVGSDDEEVGSSSVTGQIVEVVNDQFLTLKVKDNGGKVHSFLWLNYFKNSDGIQKKIKTIKGTKISIEFEEQEFYDPKINDYRNFKVIKSLDFVK